MLRNLFKSSATLSECTELRANEFRSITLSVWQVEHGLVSR